RSTPSSSSATRTSPTNRAGAARSGRRAVSLRRWMRSGPTRWRCDVGTLTTLEEYRRQLTAWADGMAVGPNGVGSPAPAPGYRPAQVDLFTEGNLDKRREKLLRQLELVAQAFEDFSALVNEYITSQPLAGYDTGASDGENMLRGLEQTRELTA